MKVFVYWPKQQKDIRTIQQKVAAIYAKAAGGYLESLPCPTEQKLKLLDELQNTYTPRKTDI